MIVRITNLLINNLIKLTPSVDPSINLKFRVSGVVPVERDLGRDLF
jgi:hypothetical protein